MMVEVEGMVWLWMEWGGVDMVDVWCVDRLSMGWGELDVVGFVKEVEWVVVGCEEWGWVG